MTSGPEFGGEISLSHNLPLARATRVARRPDVSSPSETELSRHDRGNESVLSPTSLQNKSSSGYKPEVAEAR